MSVRDLDDSAAQVYAAAAQLAARYAHALDTHDWPALAKVFTLDAVMDFAHVGGVTGPGEIGRVCAEALEQLDASQHLIGSVLVGASDAGPLCRSYFHAQHVKDGKHFVVAGTYTDLLVDTVDGWRSSRRTQSITWTQGDGSVVGL